MVNFIQNIDYRRWAIINFSILALFGVILRYLIVFPTGGLNYLYILHAHSHFAFAGWSFLALAVLLVKLTPGSSTKSFKWIFLLTLICSFGMLISFSLEGYKAISIAFSTMFLFITYWFAYLLYRSIDSKKLGLISTKLIKASIWFLVLSSAGPLALGALKATGNTGPIYQNAIYFYLHFQMNGWMLLAVLGLVFYHYLSVDAVLSQQLRPYLNLFIISSLPLFFIFTLWAKPPQWLFFAAFAAAILNAFSWLFIINKLKTWLGTLPLLVKTALLATTLKVLFQVFVCVPQISEWAFQSRNLIIGYVHLITLGCVTPVIIAQLTLNSSAKTFKLNHRVYISITAAYLVLLFVHPLLELFKITIPYYQASLLGTSIAFFLIGLSYYIRLFDFKAYTSAPASQPFTSPLQTLS